MVLRNNYDDSFAKNKMKHRSKNDQFELEDETNKKKLTNATHFRLQFSYT